MKEEKLKEAFSRIKEDIFGLGQEISNIQSQLLELNQALKQLNKEIIDLKLEKYEKTSENNQKKTSTHLLKTSTHPDNSTDTSTHPQEIGGLKYPNFNISIGNKGVSTDRQTDRQTVRHIQNTQKLPNTEKIGTKNTEKPISEQISEASEIIDSLDNIKNEIKQKFRRITNQEMLVFSTIYQLEEQDLEVDYQKIASKIGLSQSSIRDYIQRMINKGIPIIKEKFNNKKIILHISPNLKKIAKLDTILKIHENKTFRT